MIFKNLRYKFDNSWLQVYPWLERDNNLSAEKGKEYFFCSCCRENPTQAFAGHNSQWVVGWSGGVDGYRQSTFKLHDSSSTHANLWSSFSKLKTDTKMLNTPLLQSLDIEKQTEKIKQWRNSIPQRTIDATLNKIRAAKLAFLKFDVNKYFEENKKTSIIGQIWLSFF